MRSAIRAISLAVLLVLAGCSGVVQERDSTATPSATTGTSATAEEATDRTTTGTTATLENPWRADEIVVATANRASNQSRNIDPLVNETLDYWNEHAGQYGDYDVRFISRPNTQSEADVVVTLVDEITDCGIETDVEEVVGCAPRLTADSLAGPQETVEIEAGYTNESTVETMHHEFGHVLGLRHGVEPLTVMSESSQAEPWPQPDARNRVHPWRNDTVGVYVNSSGLESGYEQSKVLNNLEHVFEYVNTGAESTVAENVTVVETSNREDAEIVVQFPPEFECQGEVVESGSCGSVYGMDVDGDQALEYYTEAEISVSVHRETNAWHVGKWLLHALGVEESELPAVFRSADYGVRSGNWWED